ncbi:MAG: poly(A) polymerase [Polynucleobacter sp. 32-46-5]|nr:MAG: poly(A) polymerase [Polynucleobacter sp. 32-46-5]
MITKFIKRILRRDPMVRHTAAHTSGAPKRIPKKTHRIDPNLLSKNAVKVTQTLQHAGYEAFIVGGAVRDLALGISPKDFDVATNATPEQVQKLFRKARLIGRRFQIVHVTFFGKGQPEIIEVSTFRALLENAGEHVAENGRILRDNVWGSQHEDAARRDFSINAMYYDPASETVLDYHGGMGDMQKKTLRMIGDPAKRYREDISKLGKLIHDVPSARLFDEILKLLMSGYSWAAIQGLRDAGLHHGLLPLLDHILDSKEGSKEANDFVRIALANTDQRIQAGKSVSAGFLFATLLWPDLLENWKKNIAKGVSNTPALLDAMDETIASQSSGMVIQRRFESDMREIWSMQPRFEKRVGRYPYRLIESPRFRAGYDFMLLRCATGEQNPALGEWWTNFIESDSAGQEALMASAKKDTGNMGTGALPTKRRRRRKAKVATPAEGATS